MSINLLDSYSSNNKHYHQIFLKSLILIKQTLQAGQLFLFKLLNMTDLQKSVDYLEEYNNVFEII